ncbi:MAG: sulfatase family protein [Nocardioidaceae bacterium]
MRHRLTGGRLASTVGTVVVAAAAIVGTLLALANAGTPSEAAPPAPARIVTAAPGLPNVVLITTDDMAETDLRWMPRTRRLLRAGGVEVGDFISNHPLCCPARAEILTGQHGHNNGVHDNGGTYGGYPSLERPGNHVGTWLQNVGYRTAFVGKHLNLWESSAEHQRGWTVFDPLLRDIYSPYDMTMFNNGRPRVYRNVHTSDLIGRLGVRYIDRFSASGAPFFVWTSQVAPHSMRQDGEWGPPVPAPRHRTAYPRALPPSLSHPSFNERDISDKPRWIQETRPVSRTRMIRQHRARIRSLRSVDDQVGATVRALRENGELANTYIFFTSDNGFLLGEHRLQNKNKHFEPSLQVPLLVRGPGLPEGVTRDATYGLVDLAPTFARLAGATPGRRVDGRSMLGTLRRGAPGYSHYLVQAALGEDSRTTGPYDGVDRPWWWRGVRSRDYVYVRYHHGFEELYDMRRDPAQLDNVARRHAYQAVRREYAGRLARLGACAGRSCRDG